MCTSFNRQTHVDNQVWAFFEAFQILWISLKLVNTTGQPDWGWVLALTYVVVVALLIGGSLCLLGLGCCIGLVLNTSDEAVEQKNLLKFMCHAMYNLGWKSFVFFYLLRNFHHMGNENKFTPGSPMEPKGSSLHVISGIMMLCALIDIIILCMVSDTFKRLVSTRLFISHKKEDIHVQNLSNPFNMRIVQVGANYFQRNNGQNQDEENQNTKQSPEIMDCFICCSNPSNTLVRPCNHGGICEAVSYTHLTLPTILLV